MARKYTYDHPRPCVTVDIVLFRYRVDEGLQVLLVKRKGKPFKGWLALPGGFLKEKETLEQAAMRELKEETSLDVGWLEQLYTFGEPKRDPRGRVVTVAYCALMDYGTEPAAGSDAAEAKWVDCFSAEIRNLAFDHNQVMKMAMERLKSKVRYMPIGFNILPDRFTMRMLQQLYEAILERKLDTRNFRKKFLKFGILKPVAKESGTKHRPSTLYEFDRRAYERMEKEGFNFEI